MSNWLKCLHGVNPGGEGKGNTSPYINDFPNGIVLLTILKERNYFVD